MKSKCFMICLWICGCLLLSGCTSEQETVSVAESSNVTITEGGNLLDILTMGPESECADQVVVTNTSSDESVELKLTGDGYFLTSLDKGVYVIEASWEEYGTETASVKIDDSCSYYLICLYCEGD